MASFNFASAYLVSCAITVVTTITAYYVGEVWKARRKSDRIVPADNAEPPADDFNDLMQPSRKAPKPRRADHIHDREDELVDS
jgi:hypothetical protein